MKNKSNRIIVITIFDKENENFINILPIKNCTLKNIEEILLKIYPDKKHIEQDEYGNEFLVGAYSITPEIQKLLFERFNIVIDLEKFDCFIEEEYESDININKV